VTATAGLPARRLGPVHLGAAVEQGRSERRVSPSRLELQGGIPSAPFRSRQFGRRFHIAPRSPRPAIILLNRSPRSWSRTSPEYLPLVRGPTKSGPASIVSVPASCALTAHLPFSSVLAERLEEAAGRVDAVGYEHRVSTAAIEAVPRLHVHQGCRPRSSEPALLSPSMIARAPQVS